MSITNPRLDSSQKDGFCTSRPIFLVGPLRSGTTMLRLMIGHHPKIAFPNEFEFVAPMITDKGEFPSIQTYKEWLRENRIFRNSNLRIDDTLQFEELCHNFLQQFMSRENKEIVGTTVHNDFEKLKFVWPEAKYIHILRDGRDVARSFIPMGWAGNVYIGADHWLHSESAWDKLQAELKPDQLHEVRYEELLQNPEKELRCICEFIGVEYDDSMLSYPETTSYSSPSPKYAFQWKTKQTRHELGMVESKIGDMLVKRGYELSGYPITPPSTMKKLMLKVQSKLYRLNFKRKRYGISLSLQDIFSRKLGMVSWQRKTQRRMDDIVVKYLK